MCAFANRAIGLQRQEDGTVRDEQCERGESTDKGIRVQQIEERSAIDGTGGRDDFGAAGEPGDRCLSERDTTHDVSEGDTPEQRR